MHAGFFLRVCIGVSIGLVLGVLATAYTFPNTVPIASQFKHTSAPTPPAFVEIRGIVRGYDAREETLDIDALNPYTGVGTIPIRIHLREDAYIAYTPALTQGDIIVSYDIREVPRSMLTPGQEVYALMWYTEHPFSASTIRIL